MGQKTPGVLKKGRQQRLGNLPLYITFTITRLGLETIAMRQRERELQNFEWWGVGGSGGMMITCTVQFSAQSCLTLCGPTDYSRPGFPVHHQLPQFAQTHVQRVSDAIQPSHSLSSPSPPAFNLSQYLFQ